MALELAYHHDDQGNPVSGSVDVLINGIASGRQVRAVLKDRKGDIAYNSFSTLRVLKREKLINAILPVRPSTSDEGVLFDAFGVNVAVIDSMGRYIRRDLGGAVFSKQYAVQWFLD